jgi:hypothetical protein
MSGDFDRSKSLQELEHDECGDATYDSHVVRACHGLRRKPLRDFTAEDLRLMIGQAVGLVYLVPMALERLEENPLAEGDFYAGDLLAAVLGIDDTYWRTNENSSERLRRIIIQLRESLTFLDETDRNCIVEALKKGPEWLVRM